MRVLKSIIAGAAVVRALTKGSAETKPAPLLTVEGALSFVTSSLCLAKDLSIFVGSSVGGTAWEYLPPNIQTQISDQYEELYGLLDTNRLKYGIPSASQIWADSATEYKKKVAPHVKNVSALVEKMSQKPAELGKVFVSKFEAVYPQQAGRISSNIFDFLFVIFFLAYFVIGYAYQMMCSVLCCGMCSKRAKKVELTKKKAAASPAPAVKKKN